MTRTALAMRSGRKVTNERGNILSGLTPYLSLPCGLPTLGDLSANSCGHSTLLLGSPWLWPTDPRTAFRSPSLNAYFTRTCWGRFDEAFPQLSSKLQSANLSALRIFLWCLAKCYSSSHVYSFCTLLYWGLWKRRKLPRMTFVQGKQKQPKGGLCSRIWRDERQV